MLRRETEERKEMSMNGGIFARISPLSERILAVVTCRPKRRGWARKLDPRGACIEGQRDTKRVENDA